MEIQKKLLAHFYALRGKGNLFLSGADLQESRGKAIGSNEISSSAYGSELSISISPVVVVSRDSLSSLNSRMAQVNRHLYWTQALCVLLLLCVLFIAASDTRTRIVMDQVIELQQKQYNTMKTLERIVDRRKG